MYNNWRNNFLINYVRAKILKLTKYMSQEATKN